MMTIAGSDNSGGAGIQADIKTATMLGGYASSVITALTAQNTQGVSDVMAVPADFVHKQIVTIMHDMKPDVIKIGMLMNAEIVNIVADMLEKYPDIPVVLDPVLCSSSGKALLEDDAVATLKTRLFSRCMVITPNLAELKLLSGLPISSIKTALACAHELLEQNANAVLVKGGHACVTADVTDVMITKDRTEKYSLPHIHTHAGHGTGCTLASALASFIATGYNLFDSTEQAKLYMHNALKYAPKIGSGTAPLCHNFKIL